MTQRFGMCRPARLIIDPSELVVPVTTKLNQMQVPWSVLANALLDLNVTMVGIGLCPTDQEIVQHVYGACMNLYYPPATDGVTTPELTLMSTRVNIIYEPEMADMLVNLYWLMFRYLGDIAHNQVPGDRSTLFVETFTPTQLVIYFVRAQ